MTDHPAKRADSAGAPAAAAHHDPLVDPLVRTRATVGLLAISALGALLGAVSASVSGGAAAALAALAAILLGAALPAVSWLRRPPVEILAAGLAIVCTTAAVASGEVGAAAAPVLYVPVVVYAAYFLARYAVVVVCGLAVGGYLGVILSAGLDAAGARVAVVALATIATGVFVRLVRDRVLRLVTDLDRTARTDALTGALNRLGTLERLAEELERARRAQAPCAVALGDLDCFKSLNDRFGHAAGDLALQHVARAISARLRRLDAVGRLGGDEFVVVLSNADRAAAERVVSELVAAVAAEAPDGLPVRISFGIAVRPDDGESAEALVAAADARLLRRKGVYPDVRVESHP